MAKHKPADARNAKSTSDNGGGTHRTASGSVREMLTRLAALDREDAGQHILAHLSHLLNDPYQYRLTEHEGELFSERIDALIDRNAAADDRAIK